MIQHTIEIQFQHYHTIETLTNRENWATQFVPPGGSPSAARRFNKKPKNLVQNACAAWRQFLRCQAVSRKIQKCQQTRIHMFYISNMTQNTWLYNSKN